jgi:cytochrome c556
VEENPARDIQKKDFANYVDEINKQVASLKKAADSQDSDQLLSAFTGLLKNACINCHTKYRK